MRDIFVIIRHGENVDEETNTISKKGNYDSFMEFSYCFKILIDYNFIWYYDKLAT